jgi:riboflavin kinase/FMN adenylyltransferase
LPSVITFDPHPREFFRQDEAPFHLADRREKDRLLAGFLGQMGPARVIHIRFDDALRSTGANQFVSDILVGLGVRQLYAGTDFAFGKGRGGDLQTINQVGRSSGISATAVPLLVDANTAVISSSRIRAALQAGVPDAAAEMLGHDWAVTGAVIKGDSRGRTIDFPTANIALGSLQHPAFGVYAVEIDLDDGAGFVRQIGNGVANIGIRPTVKNSGVLCEAHLFDRDMNLYDKRLLVRLKAFLRPEQKFSGIEELKNQISLDAKAARRLLPPLAPSQH